jgi:murein DD-endopeptidase MepM/ murein hydrolase activator NlpD
MQKAATPFLLGAGIALLAIWAFEKPERAAAGLFATNETAEALLPKERERRTYPTDYFGIPVAGAVHLTGTCGELRPNHFHAGVDIDGQTGDPIFAAADGYIENIKVQGSGYGNMLQIRHTNGYLTLYAHLDRFVSHIQQFVKDYQYQNEQFEVDIKPPNTLFKIKKGQQIGYLGNTGSSGGPHLHFEVRSPDGKAVNPLLCGIPITDNIPPDIRGLKVYFLNDRREVLGSKPLPFHKDKNGAIHLQGDTIRVGGSRVGFGVKAYDRSNTRRNDNGIFDLAMYADGQLAFRWTADEFDFDESRYLNAHIDYSERQKHGSWFHRCFSLPGDFLGNYTRTETMGAVKLHPDRPVKISFELSDAAGNTSKLHFWALQDETAVETIASAPYQFLFPFDSENHLDLEGFAIDMPKGTLYETLQLQYRAVQDPSSDIYSVMHQLHNEQTPVHKSFEVRVKPTRLPEHLRDKAIVANCNSGRPDNCGSLWEDGWLKASTRSFGNFCVMADTIAPRITPLVFAADMRKKKTMAFRITDNFSTTGNARGLRFRGAIDGQWVLFEYDKKRNRIEHTFDGRVGKGPHSVRISVVDDRGNEGVFTGKFTR